MVWPREWMPACTILMPNRLGPLLSQRKRSLANLSALITIPQAPQTRDSAGRDSRHTSCTKAPRGAFGLMKEPLSNCAANESEETLGALMACPAVEERTGSSSQQGNNRPIPIGHISGTDPESQSYAEVENSAPDSYARSGKTLRPANWMIYGLRRRSPWQRKPQTVMMSGWDEFPVGSPIVFGEVVKAESQAYG